MEAWDENVSPGDAARALHEAAASGDVEGVSAWCKLQGGRLRELIDAEHEEEEVTALYQAAEAGHAAVITALLDFGADPEADLERAGSTALHAACIQ